MLALYMSFIDDESHRRLFEKIYIEYRDPMFFMARSVLGNDSDAEDIVHDVFLKIAKKHMARISYKTYCIGSFAQASTGADKCGR